MTSRHHRVRSRSKAALLSAGVTVLAFTYLSAGFGPSAVAQTIPRPTTSTTSTTRPPSSTTLSTTTTTPNEWGGSHWTTPTQDGATVSDGVFSGTFEYEPGTPSIDSVALSLSYSSGYTSPPACGKAPGETTKQAPSTSAPPATSRAEPSTMDFDFEIGFTCNGLYDAIATARLSGPSSPVSRHDLTLTDLRVAVPPQQPASVQATDNGNQTVTVTWTAPSSQPPDLTGYRVSRVAAADASIENLGETKLDALTFTDSTLPPTGGSYVYRVETLRGSPNGVLASTPISTASALAVAGKGASQGGGSVAGRTPVTADPGSGGTGVQQFDDTLPADEGELGAGDPVADVPGGDTIQRFAGDDGSGLLKPFGAALNIGVWAALFLFLTRRAARAERADRLAIQIEHAP